MREHIEHNEYRITSNRTYILCREQANIDGFRTTTYLLSCKLTPTKSGIPQSNPNTMELTTIQHPLQHTRYRQRCKEMFVLLLR